MKKALGVFLMTAMAFGAFADEPVADVNIAEFSGNAAVQWGVDLDSGTTGFKNSYEVNLKLNLLNNGTKSTTGDGVWGELVLKTEKDTFIGWENGDDSPEVGDEYINANKGLMGSGRNFGLKVYVDVAKIHIGPAYIGIKRGDTQTGELKMDAAIRSADDDQSKWLSDVGPAGYSEGIVAGYDSDMFKIDLDLRSKPSTYRTGEYTRTILAIFGENGLPAAAVTEGCTVITSDGAVTEINAGHRWINAKVGDRLYANDGEMKDTKNYYTDNYAAAIEGEFKGVENLSIKAGASYNFAKNAFNTGIDYFPVSTNKGSNGVELVEGLSVEHVLGYSASAGYKLGLDDTFFIRPQVGFAGAMGFDEYEIGDKTGKKTYSGAEMAIGLLFGWGEIGMDQNAGVYYLDDDMAKKVSPGVGVVAHVPFATTYKDTFDGETWKEKMYGPIAARIMPSFYSGELIPGLTAAAYADIVIPKTGEDDESDPKAAVYYNSEKAATPIAFAFGAKYAIEAGEMTITPQAGLRFANAAYVDYKSQGFFGEKDDGVFTGMGVQKTKSLSDYIKADDGVMSDGNYMNLKLGVDVAGLIDNTTLSVTWATRNILNNTDYPDNTVGPKLGTLNFKAKIAL